MGLVMLWNTLQVKYLGDGTDKLITLQSQFKDKQHEEVHRRLITIKGQCVLKWVKMLSYHTSSVLCALYM